MDISQEADGRAITADACPLSSGEAYTNHLSRMQLPLRTTMKPVDHRDVAKHVYDYAASDAALAPLVREALGVIDDAIECFG